MQNTYLFVLNSTSEIRLRLVPSNMLSPPVMFLLTIPRRCFFCESFLLFVLCMFVCHRPTVLSAPCSLVVTCSERADYLVLLYVMFYCVFVTFPYGEAFDCNFLVFVLKTFLAHWIRISEIFPWNRTFYFTHAILSRLSRDSYVHWFYWNSAHGRQVSSLLC